MGKHPPSSGLASGAPFAPSVATGAEASGAKSVSGARSMVLSYKAFAVVTSNWTAGSTFPPKSHSGKVRRPDASRVILAKRGSMVIKKSETPRRRSKDVPSREIIMIQIAVFSTLASTDGASTGS